MTVRHLTLVVSLNFCGSPSVALSLTHKWHSIYKHRRLAPVRVAILALGLSILVPVIFHLVGKARLSAVDRLIAHLPQLLKPLENLF